MRSTPSLAILILLAATLNVSGRSEEPNGTFVSDGGRFVLAYASRLEPITINTMHAWELTLTTRAGEPVTGASFAVSGGMPTHDHGLPTAPRVTRELGEGRYLLEGVRFHMVGAWELTFEVTTRGATDRITVVLDVGPRSSG
jgi:hypothetical protein